MSRPFSLEGRVAVVVGAGGLLGPRHCAALAGAGAAVVVGDLDPRACEQVAGSLPLAVGQACDVTDPASVRHLLERALDTYGRVDVLVNNAALNDKVEGAAGAPVPFEDYPLDAWQRALHVNLTGVFLACQIIGAELARRGSGSIVNVASTYALVAPDQALYRRPDGSQEIYKSPAYPATKAAVVGLTRYLAAWWGARGVRVNALCPGGVENGQGSGFVQRYAARTPLGRMARPGEYEGAVVFLASEASGYMTGTTLVVDGGFTAW